MSLRVSISLGLALATLAALSPVLDADFLSYDDDRYVTQNEVVRAGLTLEGLRWAFGATIASNWHPLTWLSHMLDVELFGLDPRLHHATSLLLHLLNGLLILGLLERACGIWPAAFASGVFLLHPQHVESVAWVAERKDVLSTSFWLLAVAAYARWTGSGGRGAYATSLACLGLGLMAKPMLVTLPFQLLLLDVWPLRRLDLGARDRWRQLARRSLEKAPFFVLVAVIGVVALSTQSATGALWSLADLPVAGRVENAVVSYGRYAAMFVWPRGMAIFYPHPLDWPSGTLLAYALPLLLATALALGSLRRRPWITVSWLFFLVTLLPVIGLVQVGNQAMADRYTYLATVGLGLVPALAALELAGRRPRSRRWLAGLGALALLGLAATSHDYARSWRDSLSIFERAIAVTRENATAHNTVGWLHLRGGDPAKALPHLDEAVRISPLYALAHFNRGQTLAALGRPEDASRAFERSLRLRPGYAPAHIELARTQAGLGQLEAAITSYERGLALEPERTGARTDLAAVHIAARRYEDAIRELLAVLALEPAHTRANALLELARERSGA